MWHWSGVEPSQLLKGYTFSLAKSHARAPLETLSIHFPCGSLYVHHRHSLCGAYPPKPTVCTAKTRPMPSNAVRCSLNQLWRLLRGIMWEPVQKKKKSQSIKEKEIRKIQGTTSAWPSSIWAVRLYSERREILHQPSHAFAGGLRVSGLRLDELALAVRGWPRCC